MALAITGTSFVYIVSLLVALVASLNVSSCNIISLLRNAGDVTLVPILLVISYIGNGWYLYTSDISKAKSIKSLSVLLSSLKYKFIKPIQASKFIISSFKASL